MTGTGSWRAQWLVCVPTSECWHGWSEPSASGTPISVGEPLTGDVSLERQREDLEGAKGFCIVPETSAELKKQTHGPEKWFHLIWAECFWVITLSCHFLCAGRHSAFDGLALLVLPPSMSIPEGCAPPCGEPGPSDKPSVLLAASDHPLLSLNPRLC